MSFLRSRTLITQFLLLLSSHHSPHHLLSSIRPLVLASSVFPWQTFTMSLPLQQSVGLLRRRRPLSCMLAFSHPFRVMQFQSSLIPTESVIAPLSRLLYAGWSLKQSSTEGLAVEASTVPFGCGA